MPVREGNGMHRQIGKAPVAQLDRASDFESAGRPFESGRARQGKTKELERLDVMASLSFFV
jgi:hypothetical protein